MQRQYRFSDYFYNKLTYIGVGLSLFTLSFELVLYLLDVFVKTHTPYVGLIAYLVLPPFVILGLLLIPIGAFLKRRRVLRGTESIGSLCIDFSKATHRNAIFVFIIGTTVFLIASTIGLYQSYHFMESVEFCGQVCHSVMEPEFTVYKDSPHARVKCVECHIGPGAGWFAKSKLSGAYQVYSVNLERYSKPIETPVKDLRPARETCEHCHWPKHFSSAKEKIFDHYLSDEENTHWPIRMLINIGGVKPGTSGHTGIHWHIDTNNEIQYIAKDKKRQEIVWLKHTDKRKGKTDEYFLEDDPLSREDLKNFELRQLDCIDCHNRPTHRFDSPIFAVNKVLAAGLIDKDLPYIKREAVKVLSEEYASTEEASEAIQDHLTHFYQEEYPSILKKNSKAVQNAIQKIQDIYKRTQFPDMKVRWDTHFNNISHVESNGCFRCHGSSLVTKDGKKIDRKCNSCHTILSQGTGTLEQTTFTIEKFKHPIELGLDPEEMECSGCHTNLGEMY